MLAERLRPYADEDNLLVLGLPRGGVLGSRAPAVTAGPPISERPLSFLSGDTALEGNANIPSGAREIVIFAHGKGSGRTSPRSRYVASVLNEAGFATLLIDLLPRMRTVWTTQPGN